MHRQPDTGRLNAGAQDPMRGPGRNEQGFACLKLDGFSTQRQLRLPLEQTNPFVLRLVKQFRTGAGWALDALDVHISALQQGFERLPVASTLAWFEQIQNGHDG
jgi:hypothetical protein